jgi:hypothetical protein
MSTIYVGTTSPPSVGLGSPTDIYVNTVTGDFFQKDNSNVWVLQGNIRGPQGLLGPQGPQGVRGSITYTMPGPPNPLTGVNNDSWLNATTGDLYLKINGSWVIQGNIRGPQGQTGPAGPGYVGPIGPQGPQGNRGTNITAMSRPPTNLDAGINGDVWLNTANGDVYRMELGTWQIDGNIRGPIGLTGAIGPQGPPGPPGPSGFPDIAQMTLAIDLAYPSNYKVFTYSGGMVTDVDIYDSEAMVTHIFNKAFTYNVSNQITSVLLTRIADGTTLEKIFTYTAGAITDVQVIYTPG